MSINAHLKRYFIFKSQRSAKFDFKLCFCLFKSTSNYNARRFGVRAAMPGFIAKKLCPHLIIVPLNFKKYQEVSKEVSELFHSKHIFNHMIMSCIS